MIIDTSDDIAYWGIRNYEGIDFVIEKDTELSPLCPFQKPKNLLCPHSGLTLQNRVNWEKRLFMIDDSLTPNKLLDLIPDEISVYKDLCVICADYLPKWRRMNYLLSLTNAIPLFIYGLKPKHDYDTLFKLALDSKIRPVYISGSSLIPIPQFMKGKEHDNTI